MVATFPIPRANAPLIVSGGMPTREWYSYWQNLQAYSGGPSNAELANDITIIAEKLGSPDGTPENIPPITPTKVEGLDSVAVTTSLSGIVQVSLQGDVDTPGNTYYYGTGPTGAKGYYTVASTFLGTADNIDLSTNASGITTIAISATYPGQASIVTVGTITTGVWHGTAIDAAHGGTGLTTYTVGDLLYASGTATLSRLADVDTGSVLRSGGVGVAPAWGSVDVRVDSLLQPQIMARISLGF